MAQVILLHPSGGYWEYFRTAPNLPLNLLSVAAYLTDSYSVEIVDMRLGPNWKEELAAAIGDETICAGVTTYTGPSINNALDMCREVRRLSDVPIIWGGIHVSLTPEQSVRHPLVDAAVISEGELTFREVVETIEAGGGIAGLRGVATGGPGPVDADAREFVDMDTMPELPYGIVDIEKYLPKFLDNKTLNFQGSRGCPRRCGFCYNSVFNRSAWRAMSVENVMQRLERAVDEFGVRDVLFVDDNMFVDLDRARSLIEALQGLDITWQSQGVDVATLKKMPDDLIQMMCDSGCRRIAIGVESGSQRIRRMLGKPGGRELVAEQVRRLKKFDVLLHCTFIGGFPGETRAELGETVSLMKHLAELNPSVRTPFIYKYFPCPGTKIYDLAVEGGFSPPGRLEDWNDVNVDDFSPRRWNFPLGRDVSPAYLENLWFVSHFLDAKDRDYNVSFFFRAMYRLYRPVARLRVRFNLFSFAPEKKLFDFVVGALVKRRNRAPG